VDFEPKKGGARGNAVAGLVLGGGGLPPGEELNVTFRTEQGGAFASAPGEVEFALAKGANLRDHPLADGVIAHHTVRDIFASCLELRFDKGNQRATRRETSGHRRENKFEGYKGDIGNAKVGNLGEVAGREVTAVKLLLAPDPRVAPQAVV